MEERNYQAESEELFEGEVVFLKEDNASKDIKQGIYEIIEIGKLDGENTKVTIQEFDNYDGQAPLEIKENPKKAEVTLKELDLETKLLQERCRMCETKSYLFVAEKDFLKRKNAAEYGKRIAIQDSYPYLTIPQRELAKTGMCYNCQQKIFTLHYDKKGKFIGDQPIKPPSKSLKL